MISSPAPIVLFVYNRPDHTRRTLNALKNNELSRESSLFIYADGAKVDATIDELTAIEQTRNVIREQQWCGKVCIIESISNKGLATSIIDGVTEIVEKYGAVIVLEDDIVTSSGFLNYMNDALKFYEKNDSVMHISGYMYPHNSTLPESFFYNVTLCWGWATWKKSWKHYNNDAHYLWKEISRKNLFNQLNKFGGNYLSSQLGQNITGKLDTWFIKWHASVLLKNGYTLFPRISLVNNIGFDNSGVHNGSTDKFENKKIINKIEVSKIAFVEHIVGGQIMIDFYNQLNITKSSKVKFGLIKKNIKIISRKIILKIVPEITNNTSSQNISVNSFLGASTKIYPNCRMSNSIIGDYTYIAENSIISNTTIGRFCSIGPNLISGWGIHPTNGISTHPMFYSVMKQNGMTLSSKNKIRERLPIEIGNDVFIGMNVTILDGVTIGDGAVIGAGAVVSKDIPPYAIAFGTPIRIARYRFNDDIIKSLLQLKWWEFNLEKLKAVEEHIFNIEAFLDKYRNPDC